MHFEPDKTYHIYNRSNEKVFYNDKNYIYFLTKIKKNITPFANILAWCLMPNHFHFLITAKNEGCNLINEPHRSNTQILSKNIGTLLSSYTQAINKEHGRRGKLFAHNTKAKCLNDTENNDNYAVTCFHYIHQNPLKANLCNNINDWKYSSYLDYIGKRNGTLINKDLAYEIINYDKNDFELQSLSIIDDNKLKGIF